MTPHRAGRCRHVVLVLWLVFVFVQFLDAKPIRLRNGTIDPAAQRETRNAERGTANRQSDLFLLQFKGPVEDQWREQLTASAVRLLRYVPEDTYVARIPANSLAQVRALPFVEWVGDFSPEHKFHSKLRDQLAGKVVQNTISVSLLLAPDATPDHVRGSRGLFRRVHQQSSLRFGTILRGQLSPAALSILGSSPMVLWIEPGPNFKLVDEVASDIVAGEGELGTTLMQWFGFDGRGVNVAVADSGLNNGDAATMHPDLFGRVRSFFFYGALTDAADEHSHGTHVAGIIAGNGAAGEVDDTGALYGLGVAPQAQIIAQRIFDGDGNFEPPDSFEVLTHDAVRGGADIGSNSWGDDTQGRYDLSAAEFDALVRDADADTPGDQQYILEFSAGNAGPGSQTIGSPAVAKNVIATGACENNRSEFIIYGDGPDVMADFSSRGPCEDGRIKPDLVAPGTWIASLQSASATDENAWMPISANYMYMGGTSQAGPHASGAAAVLVQYFREVYGMPHPSPALVKAALINSAVDMDNDIETDPVPNMDEGWGRIDLTKIVISERSYELVDQTPLLTQNQVFEKRVLIGSSDEALKITLAYTDVPGFPAAIPALVNDLDLEVVGPNGLIYRGNQFSDGESVPNPAASDSINNVEAVHIAQPLVGEYIVRIRGKRIVEDARKDTAAIDQDFALVVSGNIPPPGTAVLLTDRPAYTAPSHIDFKLFDSDLIGQSSFTIDVRSTSEPTAEHVTLRPFNAFGGFTGSIATVTGTAVADGRLQIKHGDSIDAIYRDGAFGTHTLTLRADLVPPVLSAISVTNEFGRTSIQWHSDEPANGIVRFGTNAALTSAATNIAFSQDHQVELRGLVAGRTYYFVVISADYAGNLTTNNNGGAPFSFVALGAAPVLLVDAYEADEDTTPLPRSGYTIPLDQAGIRYEVWDATQRGSPTADDLRPFDVVIWRVSDSPYVNTTLSSQDQVTIQNYLNGGGAFFMSSMEVLTRIGDVPFRRNVLHVQQFVTNPDPFSECPDCDEDHKVPTIRGAGTDPIASGVLVNLDYSAYPVLDFGFFVFGPDFSDVFTPTTNAAPIILEHFSSRPCGMKYPRTGQDSTGRVVFLSFPIDTVPLSGAAPNNRSALFRNLLQFLAPGLGGGASIVLDRSTYTLPDVATVEVADTDLAGTGQLTVQCYSQSFSNRVNATLHETVRPGLFRGIVLLAPESDLASGKVRARNGNQIYADYLDTSAQLTVQANAAIDTIAPSISGLFVDAQYEDAFISWDTSEDSDALVEFGESTFLGKTAYSSELSDSHELHLSSLQPDRIYYYKIVSRDAAGNAAEDDNHGQLYTFRTLRPITPPWQDNLETGAGDWTTYDAEDSQSTWTLGRPNNGLETQAHSPVNAWGCNLNGDPIDYADIFLISPAIDLRGGNLSTLRFYHSFDFSTDKTEFDIIEAGQLMIITNIVTAPVPLRVYSEDFQNWDEEVVDLSPYTGHVVFLVWEYQLLSIDAVSRPGWLVDDVSVSLGTASILQVSNNLSQAQFVLTGPAGSRNGQGILTSFTNLPPGSYTVTFSSVPYYQTPGPQTQTLPDGGFVRFVGNYSFTDANNNGMSDTWEQQFFGSVSPSRTSTTDTDHDGATDYAEFSAGTNPNDATSYLKVLAPALVGNNSVRLSWPSVIGRSYRVQSSSNALNWNLATDWIRATATTTTITLPTSAAFLFRIEVRP